MSRVLAGQVVRFALVGVVNTATYYGTYLLLRHPLGYLAAHVVGFAVSTVGSFLLNSYVTYRTRPTWRKFVLFPLTVAANFVITTIGVTVLVEIAHMDQRIAPLVAAAGAIPVTFFATRYLLLGPKVQAG
ncbi:MAG: putative sugar translocase [Frankiales bacterium]|nr:putative sugar translocase [Frankiales bacterium]